MSNISFLRALNKYFYILIILLIIITIVFAFIKFEYLKNYPLRAEASCNPEIERCFYRECYSDVETCVEHDGEEIIYYKTVEKDAYSILQCEQTDGVGCVDELSCVANENKCSYIYCDPDNLGDALGCSN